VDDELLLQLLTDPVFLGVAGGLLLILLIVAVVVGRRLARRVRRLAGQNAHLTDRARAEVHARRLPEGPARTAAQLRRRLLAAVTETDRVISGTDHALVSATLADQHRELRRLATALDAHLLGLARDPDPARVETALPEARQWTDQLCDVAGTIREGVRRTGLHGGEVTALGESTSDATAALRAGVDYLQERVHRER
jgi:hypothetical protein